jgi:transposase
LINLDKIDKVYLYIPPADMRKAVNGLSVLIETDMGLSVSDNTLYVFCNKDKNMLKILHYDHGFWLYYRKLEKGKFKWPEASEEVKVSFEELKWFINGHELRLVERKYEPLKKGVFY